MNSSSCQADAAKRGIPYLLLPGHHAYFGLSWTRERRHQAWMDGWVVVRSVSSQRRTRLRPINSIQFFPPCISLFPHARRADKKWGLRPRINPLFRLPSFVFVLLHHLLHLFLHTFALCYPTTAHPSCLCSRLPCFCCTDRHIFSCIACTVWLHACKRTAGLDSATCTCTCICICTHQPKVNNTLFPSRSLVLLLPTPTARSREAFAEYPHILTLHFSSPGLASIFEALGPFGTFVGQPGPIADLYGTSTPSTRFSAPVAPPAENSASDYQPIVHLSISQPSPAPHIHAIPYANFANLHIGGP
ncbi:hypothetical protein B0I35DRAFT_102009 [Stachybotrys elegans]|uniref:Uncharacterized protein n=1 Tax=Stachybotrys elegans TaxID=80388 RepID=A0A8K0SHQ9_9HYPO|nr:hypothetical protein B0I35DRAFT_102009 [Stachybotrys elegans]